MIDCSKTENYMHEKARMTKSVVNGVCHIRCTDCPLSRFNNNEKNSLLRVRIISQ